MQPGLSRLHSRNDTPWQDSRGAQWRTSAGAGPGVASKCQRPRLASAAATSVDMRLRSEEKGATASSRAAPRVAA